MVSNRKQYTTPEGKILRLGVIQAGRIVEEQLVRRPGPVTVGGSARNTIVVPASSLPSRLTLFEQSADGYTLVFTNDMDGRVLAGGKVVTLQEAAQGGMAQNRGKGAFSLKLGAESRGKLMLGDVTLLYQFVVPPPIQPRPQLPPSVRGSLIGQIDWLLTSTFSATGVVVTALLIYLQGIDITTKMAADIVPDDFARYVPTMKQPEPLVDIKAIADVGEKEVKKVKVAPQGQAKKAPSKDKPESQAPACDEACQAARAEARRAQLAEQVAKLGALKILGAKGGESGSVADQLVGGDPGTDADRAFSNIGGITTAGSRGNGLRGKGSGGTGSAVGIGDLGGRVGGPGSVETGGKVEEKVPRAIVKNAAPPEYDSTLKGDAVASVIRRGMSAITSCYQRGLKRNPSLSGKIAIRLIISASGKVSEVEIEQDTIGDQQVSACIMGYAQRWRFPPPEGGGVAEVAVPFVFQAAQ
jgi:TonB family protein